MANRAEDMRESGDGPGGGEVTDMKEKTQKMKQAVLVVSFGTSYRENLDVSIGAVEKAVGEAFPGFERYRAFTSQMIINKLRTRDGLEIDNMREALERAAADGVETLLAVPTHMMAGIEYEKLAGEFERYKGLFRRAVLAKPLFTDEEDFEKVIRAVAADMDVYDDGSTAVCLMGHGTEAASNAVYTKLQDMLFLAGHENYYVGTVEANPTIENLVTVVKRAKKYKRVVLKPLMVVAGDHANKDMAGEDETSWKRIFEAEGYEVLCLIEGMGQMPAIRDIYVDHAKAALEGLEMDANSNK